MLCAASERVCPEQVDASPSQFPERELLLSDKFVDDDFEDSATAYRWGMDFCCSLEFNIHRVAFVCAVSSRSKVAGGWLQVQGTR